MRSPSNTTFSGSLIVVAAFIAAAAGAEPLVVAADHPHIRYTGRWDFSQPTAPRMHWQGSSIQVWFTGTALSASLENSGESEQYRVIVDGKAARERLEVAMGTRDYRLASGLDARAVHHVELFKETFYGDAIDFHGLRIEGGELRRPPARPSLKIAFFGDSNTAGASLYSEKDSGDSGSYYAYPALASRMLGAEMHLQAMGGATLAGPGANTVSHFIHSPDRRRHDPAYRSGFRPDVIVVNAGANDLFRIEATPSKRLIKDRYRQVVAELRTVYGHQPHIVLFNAYGWHPDEPAGYSREVVTELGGRLSAVHFPWLWEQWHGAQWDHSGQAHRLAEHIASLNPEWSIKKPGDIVDGFGRDGDFANGGFEHSAPFGGFGWRYAGDGVERVRDPRTAAEGQYFIRLKPGQQVHQPTDATGDFLPGATRGGETYLVRASIRGTAPGARAVISSHFEGQQLFTHDDDPGSFQNSVFELTTDWREYVHRARAPEGIWTLFHYLIAERGTVEFDNLRLCIVRRPECG